MDSSQNKNLFFIFVFLVILFLVAISVKSDNIFKRDPELYEDVDLGNNTITNTNNNEDYNYNYNAVNTDDTKYYKSDDGKYSLNITPSKNRYLLTLDGTTDSITGSYSLDTDKINLIVEAGCLKNNTFTCTLPSNTNLIKNDNTNTLVLDYTDARIKLGDINLNLK